MAAQSKFPWRKLIAPVVGAACGLVLVLVIDSESAVPWLLIPMLALIALGMDRLLSGLPDAPRSTEIDDDDQDEQQPQATEAPQVQDQPIPEPPTLEPVGPTPNWWYASQGERIGPLTFSQMRDLVVAGKVALETKVWNGEGDWRPAKETELKELLIPASSPTVPPPLTGSDVDNRFVWAIITVPLIGVFVEIFVKSQMWVVYLVVNSALCLLDERKLKKAGYNPPNAWWVLFVPVYLWKRATVLNQKRVHFWSYTAASVASAVLSFIILSISTEYRLEEAAKPIVTQIVKNQWNQSAECSSVSIYDNITLTTFRAAAYLDDGRSFWISIEERGGMIYVNPLSLPAVNSY